MRAFGLRPRNLAAFVAALVLLASFLPWPAVLEQASLCSFRNWTGLPCPACGLTRGFRCLAHGEIAQAWTHHPFALPLFLLAIGLATSPLWARVWPAAGTRLLGARVVGPLVGVLTVGLLGFGAWRLVETATRHS